MDYRHIPARSFSEDERNIDPRTVVIFGRVFDCDSPKEVRLITVLDVLCVVCCDLPIKYSLRKGVAPLWPHLRRIVGKHVGTLGKVRSKIGSYINQDA